MNSIRTSFTTVALFVMLIFTCIAYVANAQGPTTSPSETRAQTNQPAPAAAIANQDRNQAALNDRQQERLRNLAANVSNRMEAAIARLENIADRLEERLFLLADDGVDTAAANLELSQTFTLLNQARNELSSIDQAVNAFVSSEQPRTVWPSVRDNYIASRENIVAARTALRAAVQNAQRAAAGNRPTSSAQPSTTTLPNNPTP